MNKQDSIKTIAEYFGTTQSSVARIYQGLCVCRESRLAITSVGVGAVLRATSARLSQAAKAASEANPRKQNWRNVECRWSVVSLGGMYSTSVTRGKWISHEYTPVLQSRVEVSDDMLTAIYTVGQGSDVDTFTRPAPTGMQYCPDEYGVALRRLSDGMDYHPTAEDFESRNFAARCRKAMAQNWRARQQAKRIAKEKSRMEAIKRREIGSVRVTLADSRRAGNCVEGSLRYAETRLHISREEILAGDYLYSVPASRLLAANGDERVQRAVNIAWLRETTPSI